MKVVFPILLCLSFVVFLVGCGGGGGSDGIGQNLSTAGNDATVPTVPAVDTARAAAGLGQSGGGVGLIVTQTTIAQEEPLVNTQVTALKAALSEKKAEDAANLFHESVQSTYKDIFAAQPDKLPALANALENAKLTVIGDEYGGLTTRPRRAELAVAVDGITFHVEMIKVGENWLFTSL